MKISTFKRRFLLSEKAVFWLIGGTVSLFLIACQTLPSGEVLAARHCQACHALPQPGDLDKTTWENHVLPRMRYFVGLDRVDFQLPTEGFETGSAAEIVQAAHVLPTQAQMTEAEWQQLSAYFLANAPDQLSLNTPAPEGELALFSIGIPNWREEIPSTTLVQVRTEGGLWMSGAKAKRLRRLDEQLTILQEAQTLEGTVALQETPAALYLTQMGQFSPTDQALGEVMVLPKQAGAAPKVLLTALQRPVDTRWVDLNQDQRLDAVISEFGKWSGGLSWWEGKKDGKFEEHILRPISGAIQTEIVDLNRDSLPDILALFGQGNEGLFYFENTGSGAFTSLQVLSFSPSRGTASMEVVDWNADGWLDVLICQGDNADYPPMLKPYHGIRLFLNQQGESFAESFFLPLPGAYEALVRDFDQDGDKDIAAISFFPDYRIAEPQSFVYFENRGNDQFKRLHIPGISQLGRWLVMDAGDIDLDGDEDIVLGSLMFEVPGGEQWVEKWTQTGIPLIMLLNQTQP